MRTSTFAPVAGILAAVCGLIAAGAWIDKERPMDMPNTSASGETDINAQLKHLREQIDKLLNEHAAPRLAEVADQLSEVADRAQDVARRGYKVARENVDAVSERVKEQPLGAVMIAAVAGFLLGRMFR
jgi:ElaB/YqjD/DUF883 family membrane-anchored ribosome-binding protein